MHHLIEKNAPLFTMRAVMPKAGIGKIDLAAYMEQKKWIILLFYPGDFAIETPAYITILSDRYEEFKRQQAELIGISTDTIYTHLAWIQLDRQQGGVGPIHFPLASDRNFAVSTAYGVLNQEIGMPIKTIFIIDPTGKIRYMKQYHRQIHYNVDEVLQVLSNLQKNE